MLQQQENIRPNNQRPAARAPAEKAPADKSPAARAPAAKALADPTASPVPSPHNIVQINPPSPAAGGFRETASEREDDSGLDQEVDLNQEVTIEHLQLWLRRCRRKYIQGVTVIKIANTGKLVRRQLYINAKPEYIELISSRLFDTAYHLGSVDSIKCSRKSPEFEAFAEQQPGCLPKLEKSLVLTVDGRSLSLVFKTVSDRLDAQLYLKAWCRMIKDFGGDKLRDFERRCTIPGMIAHRKQKWGEEDSNDATTEGDTTVIIRGSAYTDRRPRG